MSMVAETMTASHAERGLDLYETPPEAVRALMQAVELPRRIWDPACGPGAILDVIHRTGRLVWGSDVADYGGMHQTEVLDFLRAGAPLASAIVTNPPYKLAADFVRQALRLAPDVHMLMRLAFLEGTGRSDILDGGHLHHVRVFRNRLPMMHRDGWEGNKLTTGRIPFAWFHWNRAFKASTIIERITWEKEPCISPSL
jgi:hypothetical protein